MKQFIKEIFCLEVLIGLMGTAAAVITGYYMGAQTPGRDRMVIEDLVCPLCNEKLCWHKESL